MREEVNEAAAASHLVGLGSIVAKFWDFFDPWHRIEESLMSGLQLSVENWLTYGCGQAMREAYRPCRMDVNDVLSGVYHC